jgi:hypothetical protein
MITSCIGCKHYDKEFNEEPCVSCVDYTTMTRALYETINGKKHFSKMPGRCKIVDKGTYYATEEID